MTGDNNSDKCLAENCRTLNLQIHVCSVCGEDHEAADCTLVQNLKSIYDSKILSHARQTLPKGFDVKYLADGSTTVTTNVRIEQGTKFGPFQAPLSIDLPPTVLFPLKVFGNTLDEGYYLDTTDEDCCNWMCLVASASSTREQNLICFDVKQSIYFATTRDVEPGQELRLWYALYYGLKLQALPLSDESNEERFSDLNDEVQGKSNNGIGNDVVQTLTQHLPAHALGASGERDVWICKLCGTQESNVASYARHLMVHYRQPVYDSQHPQCTFCSRRFFSKKVLEKHILKHGNCDLPEKESLETANNSSIAYKQLIENIRLEKEKSLDLLVSNKVSSTEITSSGVELCSSQIIAHEQLQGDKNSIPSIKFLDSNIRGQSHVLNSDNELDNENQYKVSPKPDSLDIIMNLKIGKVQGKNVLSSSHMSDTEKLVIHSSNGKSFSTSFDISASEDIDTALENGEPLTFIMSQSTDENNISVSFERNIVNNVTNETLDLTSTIQGASNLHSLDQLHQEQSVNQDVFYNCDICQKSFSKVAYLYRHLRKHTGEFTCVTCLAVFARKENLKSHSCNQPKEWFPCPKCGRKFSAKKYLQRHIPIHTGEFTCSMCNRHFVSKLSLKYHRCNGDRHHTGNEPISCIICERIFSSELKLRAHLKNHSDLKSKPIFLKSQNMQRQSRKRNAGGENNEEQHKISGGKLFICEICGAIFKSSSSMKTHRFCHGERKFECTICEKRFHRKDVLQEHSRVHEEANFPCELCGKKYKTKKSLYVHSLIHEGSKRFSCNECGKEFFQKGNLLKHAQTHTTSRMYCCQYCKKSFSSKEYFNIHQLTHTQGKIYRCDECKRGFVKKHLLDTHRHSFHSNRGFLCKFCNNAVRHRHSIRRHLEKSHDVLRGEWSAPGFIDALQIELPPNILPSLGDAKLTPLELQKRQNQIEMLRKKHFQNIMFSSLDASDYTYALNSDSQPDQFTMDDPVEMLQPSQQLALDYNFPSGDHTDSFPAAGQLDLMSKHVQDTENEVVFTLVNEEICDNTSSNAAPYLTSSSLESSISDFDSGTTYLMENEDGNNGILLYVVEASGEDGSSEGLYMVQ